ncbi:MAG: two-component regulator propeller domain-containing protein [Pirellulaceae bacterium]
MWIGTFGGGLFRYDGRELKRFSENNCDLVDSNVTALHQDSDGVIWIGTLSGLNAYDKRTNKFSSIPLLTEDTETGTIGVWTLYAGDDEIIWIGTNGHGLLAYDLQTDEVKKYVREANDDDSIPSNNIYRVSGARDGKLLLSTFGGGFARFDPETRAVDLTLGLADGLGSTHVWSAYEDHRGWLWIGTQNGLDRVDPETNEIESYRFVHDDPTSLGGPIVTDIREDRDGNYWVTSFNGDASLSRLDTRANRFTRFGTRDSLPGELSQRGARTMFEDDSGIFWIVSLDGLVKYDPKSVGFSMVSLGSGLLPMYEDDEGNMWLGAIAGLRKFDKERRKAITVGDEILARELVTAFYEDSRDRFWMGIYGGDLVRFDPIKERTIERFSPDPMNPDGIPESNCIRRILEVKGQPGKLWLLTQGGGLVRFDPESGTAQRFQHDPTDPNSLCSDTASYGAIIQDANAALWVGTDNGLDYWLPDGNRFRHFWDGQPQTGRLQSGVIQAMHRDDRGDLWIGTSKGLHRLTDFDDGKFEHFGVEQGLADNNILGILESRNRL